MLGSRSGRRPVAQDPVVLLQKPLVQRLPPKPVEAGSVLHPSASTSSAKSLMARRRGFS